MDVPDENDYKNIRVTLSGSKDAVDEHAVNAELPRFL